MEAADHNQAKKRKLLVEDSETASSSKLKTTESDHNNNQDKDLIEDLRSTGSSSSLDLVSASASCCSTTVNQEENEEKQHSWEVEAYSMCCNSSKERRDATTASGEELVEGELDSVTSKPPSTTDQMKEYSPRPLRIVEKMERPTEAELEDFFAKAERDIRDKFVKKYNYDTTTDEPLEGRYEWIRLKP